MHSIFVRADKFKRLSLCFLFFVYSFLIEAALGKLELEEIIALGFVLLIVPCYIFLLVSSYTERHKFGFMFLFILLTLLFYYGQYFVIIAGFRQELEKKYVSLICGRIENIYIIKAFFIHIRAVLMLYIGYEAIFKDDVKHEENEIVENSEIFIPSGFSTVAMALFIVSAICQFVVLFYNISVGSYNQLRAMESEVYRFSSGNIMFYFGYFSKWFLPSSYMLLLKNAICKERKSYWFIVIVLAVFMVMYVQTGARFTILKILTALFVIHSNYVRKIGKADLKWIVPIGLVGVVVLSILSDIRSNGVSLNGIISAIKTSSPAYIIYDVFSESGATAISLANTLQNCPSPIPHKYFEFFLKMVANILPSFMNPFYSVSMTTTSAVFSPLLYGYTGSGYGSSFITEAYYYWGAFLYPVLLIYGLIISKLDNVFNRLKKMNSITKIFGTVYLLSEMIYWVRNDIFEIGRSYIYCVALPLLLISLLNSVSKRKRAF